MREGACGAAPGCVWASVSIITLVGARSDAGRAAERLVREGVTAVKALAGAFARGVREEIAREIERREAEAAAAARAGRR